MRSRRFVSTRPLAFGALIAVSIGTASCADSFDTTRSPPPRGTVGEELYGVVCDRVGAQALHEDLTGSSFAGVCHKDANGNYADHIDQSALPPAAADALDVNGNPVTVDQQNQNRAHAVARIEALARRRGDLIAALDATFPEMTVPIKDLSNPDPTQSCNPPSTSGEGKLSDQLADMLGRFTQLYDDGTIPQATESFSRFFDAIKQSPEAQTALARFDAREGYRPIEITLGAARPAIAYPNLRDLLNASVALLSADSQPYDPNPKRDDQGNRIPVAGPANPQFNKLIDVARHEMLYAVNDPTPAALTQTFDAALNRAVLSRPRTDLETMQALFYAQDPAFGGGASKYIVMRDPRGYASVTAPGGTVPAPFVDKDHDGLADVDLLGRFVTSDGKAPPSPFFAVGQTFGTRDACGRALRSGSSSAPPSDAGASSAGEGGVVAEAGAPAAGSACANVSADSLVYGYLDTTHSFAAQLLSDMKPLTNPDPKLHDTVNHVLAGSEILLGPRDPGETTTKCYQLQKGSPTACASEDAKLLYRAFHPENGAMLDLVYAIGQMLGDPTIDDTLALTSTLFKDHTADVARLAGDGLAMKAVSDTHKEAVIPAKSVFWDDMLDVTVKIEKEPGLLEDLLRAFGDDASKQLGPIFANYMKFNDRISYDRHNLNGPPANVTLAPGQDPTQAVAGDMQTVVDRSQPDTGFNRSAMQRFLSLIHDTNGVTACNKAGAVVHAKGVALLGSADICSGALGLCSLGGTPFQECEVFKIDNLAKFYLDAIVGKASMYFRPNVLRNGIVGIGAATVDTIEQSSGIGMNGTNDTYGFWDPTTAKTFRPRPQWLNRLVFFDQANDKSTPTNQFLADLNGPHIGTSVCPERVIADPDPTAADAASDGMVHGLRNCADGDWLDQRGKDTIFVWEDFGFYNAIAPLLNAFINHNREDLFIEIMEVMNRHWQSDKGTPDECLLSSDPASPHPQCTKDGVVTYEPLMVDHFNGDILPAVHDFIGTVQGISQSHCDAVDPTSKQCTSESSIDGIAVLANATRALMDPDQATTAGLVDRHGVKTGLRNDGTTNPQVTPIYLLTGALNAMDAALDANDAKNPKDARKPEWRTARSQIVDQFLTIDGATTASTFHNPGLPKITPVLIDVLRAQLLAQCPTSFTPPFDRCDWARTRMTQEMQTVFSGPTFAASIDLMDAMRTDPASHQQLGNLLQYLLDTASKNDALPNALASVDDMMQMLRDDPNLVPLYHVIGTALAPTQVDAQGHITQKSVLDAQLSLFARISGRAMDPSGKEICASELDPNQVLNIALANLVTPMKGQNGQNAQAPLQVIMDVIGDVNRLAPEQTDKFAAEDYATVADNVSDFLLNKERGMEQFYEVVREGTVK